MSYDFQPLSEYEEVWVYMDEIQEALSSNALLNLTEITFKVLPDTYGTSDWEDAKIDIRSALRHMRERGEVVLTDGQNKYRIPKNQNDRDRNPMVAHVANQRSTTTTVRDGTDDV